MPEERYHQMLRQLSRRDFMRGISAYLACAALPPAVAAWSDSQDGAVIQKLRSTFEYDDTNEYFTDEAVARAKEQLNDLRRERALDMVDALSEFTNLDQISADDLPALAQMAIGGGDGFERIHQQVGARLQASMMRQWLAHHTIMEQPLYPRQAGQPARPGWYAQPTTLASQLEQQQITYLYPDLLNLATEDLHIQRIQPRPAVVDPTYLEEIERRAQEQSHGLDTQDRPLLDRRYLYEYLQAAGQEELLFHRDRLQQSFTDIRWQGEHMMRTDRRVQTEQAQEHGVQIPHDVQTELAVQLSSTALTYLHVTDQLITEETLAELREHIEADLANKETEYGGRVTIDNDRLRFILDMPAEVGDNTIYRNPFAQYVASDFANWHAHAIDSLDMRQYAGPSSMDLRSAAQMGSPELVVTPVGQDGEGLRLNIDMYQASVDCSSRSPTGYCPAPDQDRVDSFIADLGVYEI